MSLRVNTQHDKRMHASGASEFLIVNRVPCAPPRDAWRWALTGDESKDDYVL